MKWKFNRILTIIFTIFISAAAIGSNVFADPKTAKSLAREASRAYSDGDYDKALVKFTEAYRQEPNPAILYNLGRTYESKADFQNAVASYLRFVTSPDVDQDARADALDRIKTLNDVLTLTRGANMPAVAAPASAAVAASAPAAPAMAAASPAGCIDINTANADQLNELEGIGPAYAERIITYRTQNGMFKTPEGIMDVKGIGEKKYAKFRHQICPVGAVPAPVPNPAPAAVQAPIAKTAPVKTAPAKRNPAKVAPQPDAPAILDI